MKKIVIILSLFFAVKSLCSNNRSDIEKRLEKECDQHCLKRVQEKFANRDKIVSTGQQFVKSILKQQEVDILLPIHIEKDRADFYKAKCLETRKEEEKLNNMSISLHFETIDKRVKSDSLSDEVSSITTISNNSQISPKSLDTTVSMHKTIVNDKSSSSIVNNNIEEWQTVASRKNMTFKSNHGHTNISNIRMQQIQHNVFNGLDNDESGSEDDTNCTMKESSVSTESIKVINNRCGKNRSKNKEIDVKAIKLAQKENLKLKKIEDNIKKAITLDFQENTLNRNKKYNALLLREEIQRNAKFNVTEIFEAGMDHSDIVFEFQKNNPSSMKEQKDDIVNYVQGWKCAYNKKNPQLNDQDLEQATSIFKTVFTTFLNLNIKNNSESKK